MGHRSQAGEDRLPIPAQGWAAGRWVTSGESEKTAPSHRPADPSLRGAGQTGRTSEKESMMPDTALKWRRTVRPPVLRLQACPIMLGAQSGSSPLGHAPELG